MTAHSRYFDSSDSMKSALNDVYLRRPLASPEVDSRPVTALVASLKVPFAEDHFFSVHPHDDGPIGPGQSERLLAPT